MLPGFQARILKHLTTGGLSLARFSFAKGRIYDRLGSGI